MNRPTATRREIAPLHVPWLQHEQFPATKQACSSADGLVTSGKNSLIKVVQELKRGRANVDKQLAQLDSQLLAITDYLDSKSPNMFPPHLITVVEDAQGAAPTQPAVGVDGRRHCAAGAAAVAGKFNGIVKSESVPPTPAMVEDDLNSDTPCTSTGLWKYLYAYSFFKTITPEDMEQALLLEDPNAYSERLESSEEGTDKMLAGLDFERLQDNFSLSKSAPQDLDDLFKERLVASLCSVDTPSSSKENKGSTVDAAQPDDEDKHTSDSTGSYEVTLSTSLLHSVDLESWKPKGLTRVLRDIGLLEGSEKEIAELGVSSPRDDEVSQEIRTLQLQLRTCVGQTNEAKRKLRKIMDGTRPWLSQKKENDDATIKKYFTMWQTKKELARKKKLRDKKLQRRQALRLGGGGGSGKPLADDVDVNVKQR
ncbi:uncharacterized protein IUM83_15445 [Phytophthora cinnamomi]|uniref:uncharacterized protein n=1 Tax=Phytophthora cinnamomi TaxID=4785 RepID=UPI0035595E5D|nr:hypothetical protein IUM83_15445 [Phytophthora cinnamomi]